MVKRTRPQGEPPGCLQQAGFWFLFFPGDVSKGEGSAVRFRDWGARAPGFSPGRAAFRRTVRDVWVFVSSKKTFQLEEFA